MADLSHWLFSNSTNRFESGDSKLEELKPGKAAEFDVATVNIDEEDVVPRLQPVSKDISDQDSGSDSEEDESSEHSVAQPVSRDVRPSVLETALYAGTPQKKEEDHGEL